MLFVRAIYTLQENYSEFDAIALPGQCVVLGVVFRILGALQNYLKFCGVHQVSSSLSAGLSSLTPRHLLGQFSVYSIRSLCPLTDLSSGRFWNGSILSRHQQAFTSFSLSSETCAGTWLSTLLMLGTAVVLSSPLAGIQDCLLFLGIAPVSFFSG